MMYVIICNDARTESGWCTAYAFCHDHRLRYDTSGKPMRVIDLFIADPYEDHSDVRARYAAWLETR